MNNLLWKDKTNALLLLYSIFIIGIIFICISSLNKNNISIISLVIIISVLGEIYAIKAYTSIRVYADGILISKTYSPNYFNLKSWSFNIQKSFIEFKNISQFNIYRNSDPFTTNFIKILVIHTKNNGIYSQPILNEKGFRKATANFLKVVKK
ncbi:MAG: hypothetical protein Q7S74_06455 [Nanoarchaeota archaeon]|nr:hypothetical protein [Nanoarchaeota archaeon]